ncbi:MAG: DUF3179 domain-containing protein [Gammaproteobacteria bacterium]|nr:DUF3179 domain-containing protein [Gammaproteobacteria bacterium]
MYRSVNTVCLFLALFTIAATFVASPQEDSIEDQFIKLLFQPMDEFQNNLAEIDRQWHAEFTPMAIEVMSLAPGAVGFHMVELLQKRTGQAFGFDANKWFVWWWQQNQPASADYARFKSLLYGLIDPRFATYFSLARKSRIKLDEVRWGGVAQDGIPPLREPAMVTATEATYLDDSNVVFGIAINGDARAYPKRILAWHEMFVDKIGGVDFAGVYCTLCGAVILYKTVHEGTLHRLGTSGFLYRSNKLMYDKDTQSLWNTTWGEPVIGPLAERGIRLERSYLVTTTWGEWKRRHPATTVLSIDTGHQRNYAEGAAYREYFATDELMFSVAASDKRLPNKAEVLALTFPEHSADTMAIHAAYLRENTIYANRLGELHFVVLTDTSGANRVYASKGVSIASYDQRDTALDSEGTRWTLAENSLTTDGGRKLERLPAHRAFWFGWFAAYPDTILIK